MYDSWYQKAAVGVCVLPLSFPCVFQESSCDGDKLQSNVA